MWNESEDTGPGCPEGPSALLRRRRGVGYRAFALLALAAILLESGVLSGRPAARVLLALCVLSQVALLALARRVTRSPRYEILLGALDVPLFASGLILAGSGPRLLVLSCLMMVLLVAVAGRKAHAVAGATVVCTLHTGLLLRAGTNLEVAQQLGPEILFLAAIGVYYGSLVRSAHDRGRRPLAQQRTQRELRTLLDIQDTLTSSMDLGQVTQTIVQKITSIVPASRCSVLFVDPARTRCFVLASHDDPRVNMLEIDLQKYPEVRQAIETRSSVWVRDVSQDPLMADVRATIQNLDLQSILVIPLVFGEEVLGTLCVRSSEASRPFSRRDMRFCAAAAQVSACALKNGQLRSRIDDEAGRFRAVGDKLSRIFDHSPDLILTTDDDGNVADFSRGAERLLGYERGAIVGRSCDVLLGEGQAAAALALARERGDLIDHPCQLRKADGTTLDFELNLSALHLGGTTSGMLWLGRDVTELRAAQTQLLQAKKLSTIGEVISGVAHELSNPLSTVLGFSQLLLARAVPEGIKTDLEKINESALRCQKIVKNLLSFARGHKPERKYLGINGIIDKTLDIKRYQFQVNNIEVIRQLQPDLPRTMLDFHQIQQVLLNLFNNAQHAMAAHRDRPRNLYVRTFSQGGHITLELIDEGEGMDQETLERIFDPFFTTKEAGKGTGLGLSVSYGIIENHGGRIYARSRKGEGSTFTIELPIRGSEEDSSESESRATSRATSRACPRPVPESRILLVDDEPLILDLLIDVLEDRGYRIDTASNGDEAYRKIGAAPYDLVISDVRMPGMNGLDLYRRALAVRPELEGRVIFVTGDLIDRETVDFLAQTGARTLAKPIEIHQVRDLVQQMVGPVAS